MTSVAILLLVVVSLSAGYIVGRGQTLKGVTKLMSDLNDADFDVPPPGEPNHLGATRHAARCGQALWDRLRSVRNPV